MSFLDRLAARLGRVTRSGRVIPEIDGLRFVAVLGVVLAHVGVHALPEPEPPPDGVGRALFVASQTGIAGVQLFFAISGFVLALPFAEARLAGGRPVRLGGYYRRRVLRIEPPYLINLTLLMAVALLAYGSARADRLPHYLASCLYVHNLVYNEWSEVNFVAWSLEVEVQFYLLAPLLAQVFRVRRTAVRRALLGVAAVGLGLAALAAQDQPFRVRTLIVFQLPYFLVGFLLSDVFVTDWRERPCRNWWWDAAGLAALTGVFWAVTRPERDLLIPPLTLLAYVGAFRGPLLGRLLSYRWVVVFGGMCYTTYLYHFWLWKPVAGALRRALPDLPPGAALAVHSAVAVPVVLAGSSVLFVLFEKPFMYPDWPARLRAAVRRAFGGRGQPGPVGTSPGG